MRSSTLLFFHVLLATALLGGILVAVVASLGARRSRGEVAAGLRRLAFWFSLLAVAAAILTIGLGEALQAKEDIDASWLDASYGLAYFGLLLGGVALATLSRLALTRERLSAAAAGLGLFMAGVALAVAFLMAAKPA